MRRWLKRGLGGVLVLVLIVAAAAGAFSWRIAHEVARVERTIVVPLPTHALPTPTGASTVLAAVGTLVTTASPAATIVPAPTPTIVVPPNTGRVIADGVRTAVNDSDGHEPVWQGKQYVHILLLGLDRRDVDEVTRSDTMIIVTVDLWNGVASMLSIPRDLIVNIPGYGEDRINAAYPYAQVAHPDDPAAGPALAVETVSKAFNIPIEHYIMIDFNGFRGVVNAAGGVDIDVTQEIDDTEYPTDDYGYKHIHFDPGCYHMDGETALEYARTRHASSDNERRDRQMQVMQAVLSRTADANAARRLPEILQSLGNTVQTSLPWEAQLSLARMSRRINAVGVTRYSIAPPLVRGIITRYGAYVYLGDWPAINELVLQATSPEPPTRQDRQEMKSSDITNSAAPPRCGSR